MKVDNFEKNNFENTPLKIERATKENIEGILKIQAERLITNQSDENLKDAGFLIYPISEEEIIDSIDHPEKCFLSVAKNQTNEVVGYLLAYDFDYYLEKYPDWKEEVGRLSMDTDKEKVVYGNHVATKKGVPGVGTELENNVFKSLKEKGYTTFIAEICEGPTKNARSLNFHTEKIGLNKIGEYKDSNQYDWGIYAKKL